ncbi:N-6 DNA methylase [Candidatus Endoriftia persephonae]|jgi:type I restriction enzyme M protein|nr:N-6 DNA methylase [Candidatus Endoriftia persephone]
MAVITSLSVLYRGGSDGDIRQRLIEHNLLDAVVVLPDRLLPNTSIPIAVLIFRMDKPDDSVLFIDASNDYQFTRGQNVLITENIEKITSIYQAREAKTEQSHLASLEEIKSNSFNCSIQRYVRPLADDENFDLDTLQKEEQTLVREITELSHSINASLKDLIHELVDNNNT